MALRRSERIFKRNHRRVPNEISSIIIENLADNLPSLRNLALVCKDFAAMARPQIFREIDLEPEERVADAPVRTFSLVHRLGSLLESSAINQFIRRLHLSLKGTPSDEFEVVVRILHHLTALTSLSIHGPESGLFQEIETSPVGGTLKQLHLYSPLPCRWDFVSFKRMLLSLSRLEVLAVCGAPKFSEPGALLLPGSLKIASFACIPLDVLCAIGAGLEIAPLPSLRTLILDPLAIKQEVYIIWNGLRSDTQIIYKVHAFHSGSQRQAKIFAFATRGVAVPTLTFICHQSPWLAHSFFRIIPRLPSTVREICINIVPTSQRNYALGRAVRPKQWTQFDSVLVKRHERGLLKRVCFRCTKCKDTDSPKHSIFSYSSLYHLPPGISSLENRTILDVIEEKLPRSRSMGFLEVDRDTVFFEPTM
ncbi:hypothetical protein GYMLUDRAFT_44455 [Collybiopsis luxurians FD-317 M1]|uniref:Unplaced genomic scaffold GYMLUscaffold_31, whole genome shotgun sequence n=1 Tax=Collybiopsis luxurians FD-317 M1 TaxID=944289 RepID=A0A0D0B7N2_9AGAR|nr:hypothetical protein GYMLUDRAFT_44455 [Collybiopsis luxurians FD-317 M1]